MKPRDVPARLRYIAWRVALARGVSVEEVMRWPALTVMDWWRSIR
jgi:hypothetical protein